LLLGDEGWGKTVPECGSRVTCVRGLRLALAAFALSNVSQAGPTVERCLGCLRKRTWPPHVFEPPIALKGVPLGTFDFAAE